MKALFKFKWVIYTWKIYKSKIVVFETNKEFIIALPIILKN